jgi:ABC-type glycerol-3-phosphate transport system substrate-binding protein
MGRYAVRDFTRSLRILAAVLLLLTLVAGAATAAAPKKVRFIIDAWALGEVPFREMAKKYTALHPGLEIVIEPTPGSWGTKVAAQQKAGKLEWCAAGIIQPFLWLSSSVKSDSIVALDPWLAASQEPGAAQVLGDLLPAIRADSSMDGKLYLFPYSVENITLQYRKDYFDAAGIKAPPRSWDELYQACVAVKKSLAAAGRKDVWPLALDLDLFRGLGALYFSATDAPYDAEGFLDWKSDAMKRSLQFMRRLVAEGILPPLAGEGAELVDMWRRGRIAAYYAPCSRGTWAQKVVGFDKIATVSVPTVDGKPHSGTTFWGNCLQLFRGAPFPQEAVDFMVFAMGPQNRDWQKTVIKTGKPTAFASAFTEVLNKDPELAPWAWMNEMRKDLEASYPAPKTYYYAMQADAWNKYRVEYFRPKSTMSEDQLADRIIAHTRDLAKKAAELIP